MDDLIRIASAPSSKMLGKVPEMLHRQVGVDRERNTVMVWVTFATKESLYDYLKTAEGQADHGENDDDMANIIDTFAMYDITPCEQTFNIGVDTEKSE